MNAFFGNASRDNNVRQVSNGNDETRNNNSDEVSELSVAETHFDRQTHTHHSNYLELFVKFFFSYNLH